VIRSDLWVGFTYKFILKTLLLLIFVCMLVSGCTKSKEVSNTHVDAPSQGEIAIIFPSQEYPETAVHIREAISHGQPAICTIDRKHAEDNREDSLRGVPTKKGKDRDEWPMAMCKEGGAGADIKYINPSDNRGAGAWIRNKLREYRNGTKIRFIVPRP
jgi:hypothetical protein